MNLLSLSHWALDAGSTWIGAAALVLPPVLAAAAWRYRRLYLAVWEEQQNNKDLIENLSEGIYRSLPNGRQLSANRALVALNGYASEQAMLKGVRNLDTEWYVEPTRRDEFRRILREEGRIEGFVSEIYRHNTRERIWISEAARLVRHRKTGQPLFYEGSVREVTETVERLQIEERFQKLTRQLPGVLFQLEVPAKGKPRMAYISPGIARVTGYEHRDHVTSPGLFNSLILSADRPEYDRSVAQAAEKLTPWEVEFRILTRSGIEKWLRMTASPEKSGDVLTWHGYVADVSTRRRQEIEIEELAYFDSLTKLPNRRMFMQRIGRITAVPGAVGAVLFIDLDNFKSLNDTHGHDVGDAYLVQVAERLRGAVGPLDTVARIGGDEFIVIAGIEMAEAAHALRHAITTANRIVAALHEPFTMGEIEHVGSASVGVVAFDGEERRAEELVRRADIAMYQAKAAGRNGVALFDPSTMDREASRYKLLQELRVAIAEDQFFLHFQPQFDDERRLTGAEALIRWQHPVRGLVLPDEFVPLAEQFGMNVDLGRHILEKGLGALAAWQRDPEMAHLRLAFNVGVKCFSGDKFVAAVKELIDRHGLDAAMLTFELTENVMTNAVELVVARMNEIKMLGVHLSLDEFGTGYSSLAHLRQLPFDEVKIDGKFVADIEGSDDGRSLVRTILAMARMLRLKTVAEHVENIRQESFLRAFGCDLFQGRLYAAPMTKAEFGEFVARHQAGETAAAPPLAPLRQQAG